MNQREDEGVLLLDEPAQKRRGFRGPELLLGLVLLAIAAWGALDWWQQQAHYPHYREGLRYAEERDWEKARDAFLAAGGYGDARERAAEAAGRITERDTRYEAARQAVEAARWPSALRDLQAVHDIQPGFRDNDLLLERARREVYSLALSGTVALRTLGEPPGLYIYMADGWRRLPGSDAASQVRGHGRPACVVYDVPAPPARLDVPGGYEMARPVGAAGVAAASRLPGRRLATVRYDGSFAAQELALDPAAFDAFSCGEQGVMGWGSPGYGAAQPDPRIERARDWLAGHTLGYQPYDGPSSNFVLPAVAWAVLDVRYSEQRLVLGDYSFATGVDPLTTLFVAAPSGPRNLVAVRHAIVRAAWLSPDSRYLLVDEFSLLPGGRGEAHRLVLLATDASRPQDPLLTMEMETDPGGAADQSLYDAAFLDSGPYAGKVLVIGKGPLNPLLLLIEPEEPQQPLWSARDVRYEHPPRALPFEGGLVLFSRGVEGGEASALYLDASRNAVPFKLDIVHDEELEQVWQSGGRLVFSWHSRPSSPEPGAASGVSSIPLPVSDSPAATLLYSREPPADEQSFGFAAWSAGPGLLAYVQDGQLRAKTYDGAVDVLLESGVTALYDLGRRQP